MSNDTDHLDIWVKISNQIGELNGLIKSALTKLDDHEKRLDDHDKHIFKLEQEKNNSLKDIAIMWSIKGLVIALVIIGTFTGTTSVIKLIIGS